MAKRIKPSPQVAVRRHCLLCMGGSKEMVARCPDADCPLHPFRFGEGGEVQLWEMVGRFCLYCAGSRHGVLECPGKLLSQARCPLWPLRFGPLGKVGAFLGDK